MTARRAFTLLELLVVIAIVAILAAILFPVIAQAKRAAKDSVTVSNTKQLGTGFALYEGDFDDTIPPAAGTEGLVGGWTYVAHLNADPTRFDVSKGVVYPYIKNAGVYLSPLDKDASVSGLSFAMNGCLSAVPAFAGLVPSVSATAPQSPASQMLLTEEGYRGHGTDDGYFSPGNDFVAWHNGGTSVLFVDNHAKIVHAVDRYNELVYGDPTLTACAR